MRLLKSALVTGTAVLAMGNAVAAEDTAISYELVEPSGFTDFAIADEGVEHTSKVFDEQFGKKVVPTAEKLLPSGEKLQLRILDMDMAGDIQPWRIPGRAEPIRYIEFGYPPRITLEYKRIGPDGNVLAEGKEELVDPSFDMRSRTPHRDDPFWFETELLQDWLKKLLA